MLQTDTLVIELAAPDDFAGFRQAARVLLAQGVPPEAIHWRWVDALTPNANHAPADDLFVLDTSVSLAGRALTPDDLDQLPLPPGQPGAAPAWELNRNLHIIGGALEAGELDAKRAIAQAAELAARL